METRFRRATLDDIPAMSVICSGIWDGSDYLPQVAAEWVADPHGEFWVVETEGQVGTFGRLAFVEPGVGWLEGLRGNPALKGKGLARLLTGHLIERGRSLGLEKLRLATYQDNHESLHIITSLGFSEIQRFVCMGRVAEKAPATNATVIGDDWEDAWRRVAGSEWLRAAGGFFSDSWTFVTLDKAEFKRRIDRGDVWRMDNSGAIAAFADDPHQSVDFQINLLCGRPSDIPEIVAHGVHLAAKRGRGYVYCQTPNEPVLLDAFFSCGCLHFDIESPTIGYTLLLEYRLR